MKIRKGWLPVAVALLILTGCGQQQSGADVSQSQSNYGTTKQMVLDILHSPDGKQAIQAMLQDPQFRDKMAVSNTDVAKGVEATLKTKQSQTFLAQQMKDPKFAATFAAAVQPELIGIQKQLLKDPAYSKDLMVLMKSPEYTQYVNQLLQTPEVRGQIMKVMTDALKTPSFRMQFQDALKQAVAESISQSGGQQKQPQNGGQQGGGSSS